MLDLKLTNTIFELFLFTSYVIYFSVLPPVLVPRQSQLPPMMFRQMPENLQYNNYNQGPNSPSSSPPPNSPFQSSALSGK